jgi:hypothetical protein
MTALSCTSSGFAPRRAGPVRHSLAMAVLAVGGTFCLAAGGLALWPEEATAASEIEAAMPQGPALAAVRLRCQTCGVVESIRHSEAADGVAAFYEFAVRLPDGSLRHSSDSRPGQWQVGDRMQLLGGERTWSAH